MVEPGGSKAHMLEGYIHMMDLEENPWHTVSFLVNISICYAVRGQICIRLANAGFASRSGGFIFFIKKNKKK